MIRPDLPTAERVCIAGDQARFTRRAGVVCHDLDDEALLYDPRTGATCRLNGTARFIWRTLDGSIPIGDVAQRLTEVFDVDLAAARAGAEAAVAELLAAELIEAAPKVL